MPTAKYALRTNRSQTVEVSLPLFGIASIVDASGKVIKDMPRHLFEAEYEPVLTPVQLAGADLSRPPTRDQQLEDIKQAIGELQTKLDRLLDVALPKTEGEQGQGQ